MKTLKENNANDAGRMIQTMCVLFLGILLTNYTTNNFSWMSTALMITVMVIVFASNFFVTSQTKRNTE